MAAPGLAALRYQRDASYTHMLALLTSQNAHIPDALREMINHPYRDDHRRMTRAQT
jgi:hypothetical protein